MTEFNEKDVYVDSRGCEMPVMPFSEAFEIIHKLASRNVVSENDVAFGDAGLAAMREQGIEALKNFEDLVVNHHEILDAFQMQERAVDWVNEWFEVDPFFDPSIPSDYLRIVLAMAEPAAIDVTTVSGVEEADEADRQQLAFDVARDFIVFHGDELNLKMKVIPTAGL